MHCCNLLLRNIPDDIMSFLERLNRSVLPYRGGRLVFDHPSDFSAKKKIGKATQAKSCLKKKPEYST